LVQWEERVTWCDGVTTSARGEVAPGRGKGVDDTNWAYADLTRKKMKKIHTVNSVASNGQ
jgi:hypothetical protein